MNAPPPSPTDADAMEAMFKAADEAGKLRRAQSPKVISIKLWNGEGKSVKYSERGRMAENLYAEYDISEYLRLWCGCDSLAEYLDVSDNHDKSFDLDSYLNVHTLSFLTDIVKHARYFQVDQYIEKTFDEKESAVLTQRQLNSPLGATHHIHLHSDFWGRDSKKMKRNGKLIKHINHMFFDMGDDLFEEDEELAYGWETRKWDVPNPAKRFKKAVEESLLAE